MLTLDGVVSQQVIELFGAVATGDDDGKVQRQPERFKCVDTQRAEILYSLRRRRVVDAVVASRTADHKLAEREVWCEKFV